MNHELGCFESESQNYILHPQTTPPSIKRSTASPSSPSPPHPLRGERSRSAAAVERRALLHRGQATSGLETQSHGYGDAPAPV